VYRLPPELLLPFLRMMLAALIGLVGVIVGALLAGATTYLHARREDARHRRAAARLLEAELRLAAGKLEWLRRSLKPHALMDVKAHERRAALEKFADGITDDLWRAHRHTLAEVLSAEDWYALVRAYDALGALTNPTVIEGLTEQRSSLGGALAIHYYVQDIDAGAAAVASLAGSDDRAASVLGTPWDAAHMNAISKRKEEPRPDRVTREQHPEH
jgi:hypothetical protein